MVKPAEGKGKGLFTTRKVLAGEILLREKPLLSVEHVRMDGWMDYLFSSLLSVEYENEKPPSLADVCAEFYNLSGENQKKILSLRTRLPAKLETKGVGVKYTKFEETRREIFEKTFAYPNKLKEDNEEDNEDCTELEKIIKIVHANSMEAENEAGKSVLALYEKQINTNHSCNPHAIKAIVTSWESNETGPGDTYVVKVIKDIPENTEVMINYLDDPTDIGSRAERQKWLLENWGFSCKCEVCSLSGDDLAKNEEIRLKLKVHWESWELMQDKCIAPDCPLPRCHREELSLDDLETLSEMMDLLEQIKYAAIWLLRDVNWILMLAFKIQTRLVPTEGIKHDFGYYGKMYNEFDELLLR